jgi:hypothetical protein
MSSTSFNHSAGISLKINPHIDKIKQIPQENDCVHCLERAMLGKHFDGLVTIVRERSILPGDTCNLNKCGCRIGIGGAQDIVTMKVSKSVLVSTEINIDFATLENAEGETIPPQCIIN